MRLSDCFDHTVVSMGSSDHSCTRSVCHRYTPNDDMDNTRPDLQTRMSSSNDNVGQFQSSLYVHYACACNGNRQRFGRVVIMGDQIRIHIAIDTSLFAHCMLICQQYKTGLQLTPQCCIYIFGRSSFLLHIR